MELLLIVAGGLLGYLLGSVPVGLLATRIYGVDIRTVGSGRTGATNAWRAAGLKAAIPTLLGDALKGAAAVLLVRYAAGAFFPEMDVIAVAAAAALAGACAVVGHNWSLYLGFKGGAGGITTAATILAISPLIGGVVCLVGLLLIWWSRMASIGTYSVSVTALVCAVVFAVAGLTPWPNVIFGLVAYVAVTISLSRNRQALRDGEERVITLW
ncbi:MAG: glycerol-3-phosphate acyltransferase [Caldilineaceae bacterium]|nr:glycerol-3-phosphate acyltransferase [Caldilineaceae bacterium]